MNDVEPKNYKYDEFNVQSALDTLIKAKEIEEDSKLMSLVQDLAGKKGKAISSIAGLRKKANEMAMESKSKKKYNSKKLEEEKSDKE